MKKNGNFDGGGTAAAVWRPMVDYGRFRACLMEETCLGRIPRRKLPRPPWLIGTLAQANPLQAQSDASAPGAAVFHP